MPNLHTLGRVIIGLMAVLAMAGCTEYTSPAQPAATPFVSATTTPAVSSSSGCHAGGSGQMVLPDPACTPGAVNPSVSQANIASTICKSGWTATVRPPESYTEPIKRQDVARYGDYAGSDISAYELDHLIPLELGGSPTDQANLWPEYDAGHIPNPKDSVESAAKRAVCDGKMQLADAQHRMASNWIDLGRELGVS